MIKGLSNATNATKQKVASLLTVDFETTLRYVDIPIPPFPQADVDYLFIPERLEASLVLKWLRDSKKVSGIYELRVRDSLYLPHTEEVIAQCLKEFNVEVLDWMRIDISINPLKQTCPLLKRLTLYVSNWANLSYWVSGNGYEQLNEFSMVREKPQVDEDSSKLMSHLHTAKGCRRIHFSSGCLHSAPDNSISGQTNLAKGPHWLIVQLKIRTRLSNR